MKRSIGFIVAITILLIAIIQLAHQPRLPNLNEYKLKQKYAERRKSSVDHSQFKELQRSFESPQDVTETCINCHNQRHKEVISSSHWNWQRVSYVEGRGITKMGKGNIINNYCIGASSNEQSCAKCHIGFGMTGNSFDFNNARNVDCMVCHDQSDLYLKGSAAAGYPDRHVNLTKVAQSVGRPSNINCGSCHFYSGGGNNVKHGDLEEALLSCDRETDVHMAKNGMGMTCVDCHTAEKHQIKGKLYSVSSSHENRVTCDQCHTNTPHSSQTINVHTSRVACQTCHIPTYAKVNPTKMEWRWSTAGKLKNGAAFRETDSTGSETYMSIKGSFKWDSNVEPDYVWFNGHATHYILGDTISEIPVQINRLLGSAKDKESQIIPVKVHRGDQIFDPETKMLIQPKLYSPHKGDSAYWMDFDWKLASEAGMKAVNLPFSGEYDFVKTEMYWPVNHMVAPKEKALKCEECHTRENSRLSGLNDFYMPGRNNHSGLDLVGRLLLLGALTGVLLHGAARAVASIKNNSVDTEASNQPSNHSI